MFKVKRKLGQGGFGTIYLVKQRSTKELLAAKRVKKMEVSQLINSTKDGPVPIEIWALSNLSHPNIIKLHSTVELDKHWVLMMEYDSDYTDLFKFTAKYGALSESVTKGIFTQVHRAVTYCFNQGIDHRDIKDENILVHRTTGHVKLLDFGSASLFDPRVPYKIARGTEVFLPPEFFSTRIYMPLEGMVWSFGCLLYTMLSGAIPFTDWQSVLHTEVDLVNVSSQCKEFVTRCLEKDRGRRICYNELKSHRWMTENVVNLRPRIS